MHGPSSSDPAPLFGVRPLVAPRAKRARLRRVLSKLLHSQRVWRRMSWLSLLSLAPCLVVLALDSGSTWDEEVHRKYGAAILRWFTSGFEDRTATSGGQAVYGGMFDFIGALIASWDIVPLGIFDLLHVLTTLLAIVGLVGTWKLAACIAGPRAGFLAAGYLCVTPLWIGHGWFNPKDIPFAVGATLALYAAARVLLEPAPLSYRSVLRVGLCTGLALSFRPGGLFIWAYPLAAAGSRLFLDSIERRRSGQPLQLGRRTLATSTRFALALGLAWVVMIAAWPAAQVDLLHGPLKAAAAAAKYKWRNRVLFDGARIWSYDLPASYLPTWFSISLPDLYIVPVLCMPVAVVGALWRRDRAWPKLLCVALYVASIVLPLAGILITRPIIYDAQRHVLFLVPPFAALSGIATSYVLREQRLAAWLRALVLTSVVALAGLTLYDMRRLHPFEYIYFNRSFGGLPAARNRYETDYWGAANREALRWVFKHIPPREDGNPVKLGMCYVDWQIEYYRRAWGVPAGRFQRVKEPAADIYIATTRNRCYRKRGEVIHKVERDGVPLVYVLQR